MTQIQLLWFSLLCVLKFLINLKISIITVEWIWNLSRAWKKCDINGSGKFLVRFKIVVITICRRFILHSLNIQENVLIGLSYAVSGERGMFSLSNLHNLHGYGDVWSVYPAQSSQTRVFWSVWQTESQLRIGCLVALVHITSTDRRMLIQFNL